MATPLLFSSQSIAQDAGKAIDIRADATIIYQGATHPNAIDNTKEKPNDATYSVDVFLEKNFSSLSGKALMHIEGGQGKGVGNKLLLFNSVNRDVDEENNVHVTEAWYEQAMLHDKFTFSLGKIDPTVNWDQNSFANDETRQFIGAIFRNNPTIEFPDNTLGLKAQASFPDWLEISLGLLSANCDLEKIDQHVFGIAQATIKTYFGTLAGNYRFIGWKNTCHHALWSDVSKNGDAYGFALCFDQELPSGIGFLARYGYANPAVFNVDDRRINGAEYFSLKQCSSVGMQIRGNPWNRKNDVLAAAAGLITPSPDYRRAVGRSAENEGHAEIYYCIVFNGHFAISPDFQLIWNPFGKDAPNNRETISVIGARAQINF
jgi:carbohydrate-selective porin OprB